MHFSMKKTSLTMAFRFQFEYKHNFIAINNHCKTKFHALINMLPIYTSI